MDRHKELLEEALQRVAAVEDRVDSPDCSVWNDNDILQNDVDKLTRHMDDYDATWQDDVDTLTHRMNDVDTLTRRMNDVDDTLTRRMDDYDAALQRVVKKHSKEISELGKQVYALEYDVRNVEDVAHGL